MSVRPNTKIGFVLTEILILGALALSLTLVSKMANSPKGQLNPYIKASTYTCLNTPGNYCTPSGEDCDTGFTKGVGGTCPTSRICCQKNQTTPTPTPTPKTYSRCSGTMCISTTNQNLGSVCLDNQDCKPSSTPTPSPTPQISFDFTVSLSPFIKNHETTVYINTPSSPRISKKTSTGKVTFQNLSTGTYHISADSISSCDNLINNRKITYGQPQYFHEKSEEFSLSGIATECPNSTLSVTLVNFIPSNQVTVYAQKDGSASPSQTTSNRDGKAIFSVLPFGEYKVWADTIDNCASENLFKHKIIYNRQSFSHNYSEEISLQGEKQNCDSSKLTVLLSPAVSQESTTVYLEQLGTPVTIRKDQFVTCQIDGCQATFENLLHGQYKIWASTIDACQLKLKKISYSQITHSHTKSEAVSLSGTNQPCNLADLQVSLNPYTENSSTSIHARNTATSQTWETRSNLYATATFWNLPYGNYEVWADSTENCTSLFGKKIDFPTTSFAHTKKEYVELNGLVNDCPQKTDFTVYIIGVKNRQTKITLANSQYRFSKDTENGAAVFKSIPQGTYTVSADPISFCGALTPIKRKVAFSSASITVSTVSTNYTLNSFLQSCK